MVATGFSVFLSLPTVFTFYVEKLGSNCYHKVVIGLGVLSV